MARRSGPSAGTAPTAAVAGDRSGRDDVLTEGQGVQELHPRRRRGAPTQEAGRPMLVQDGGEALRLVRQQEHAQISGALAHAWRRPPGGPSDQRDGGGGRADGGSVAAGPGLPYRVAWATGVHDAAWTELDRTPILDPESGRPYPFHRLPLERKLGPYRRGIRRIAELDAYAGFQVSRHYCSFLDAEESPDFLEHERERRKRLRPRLAPELRNDELLDRELAYLKFFDTLSLYVCLAAPDHGAGGGRPGWLVPDDRLEAPGGRPVALGWRSPEVLVLDPNPLRRGLEVAVPYREVPRRCADQSALTRRWREAGLRHRVVRVEGTGG